MKKLSILILCAGVIFAACNTKPKVDLEKLKQDSIAKAQKEQDSLNQIKMQKEQMRIQDSIKMAEQKQHEEDSIAKLPGHKHPKAVKK